MVGRIPILLGAIAALLAAPMLLPPLLWGTDAPIPVGHTATVAAARTSLLSEVDGVFGLRFTDLVCTVDGGAVVRFEVRGPLSGGGTMTALSDDAADPARWWGGLGGTDDPDAQTFLVQHPPTDCA